MIRVATILDSSAAFAVYSDAPIDPADIIGECTEMDGGRLLFPPRFKLVLVGEAPAPDHLPADLSESLHEARA
ncbi:MAG TPA: hypothetical protein VGE74_22610 [Gemmata sp.]